MTSVLIVAGVAVVLAAGWGLFRTAKRPARGAASKAGSYVLLDHSPVGALVLDSALRITWANDAFCDLFDLTRNWWIGHEFSELLQKELKDLVEDPDVFEAGLVTAHESADKTSPFEFRVRARNGRDERWLEHTCQPIQEKPFSGGRIVYFVDITPRRDAAVTQRTQETDLHELDEILLNLASRGRRTEADEASVLREVAKLAAPAWKSDRWELWLLADDRTLWKLDRLNYSTSRRKGESTGEISLPQTGPYLRTLEQVRVLVTSDVENDPDAHVLLGQGSVGPDAASRMDIPIKVCGKLVGALVIAHHTARPWTSGETRFAASIGDRMSLVVGDGRAGAASGETSGTVDSQVPVALPPAALPPAALPPAASSLVDGFVHLDEKLRFTFLNPAALRWLDGQGVDGNTLVGRALDEAMKGVNDKSIVAEVRKALRGGGPARLRRQLEPDGPWLDVDIEPSATGVSVTFRNKERQQEREAEPYLGNPATRFPVRR